MGERERDKGIGSVREGEISYRHILGSVERFCDKALTLNATARSTGFAYPALPAPPRPSPSLALPPPHDYP